MLLIIVVKGKRSFANTSIRYNYTIILKSVKYFKNSLQIDYATNRGNSYVDRERNPPNIFKGKFAYIVALICR
jgi:hypothetical protein